MNETTRETTSVDRTATRGREVSGLSPASSCESAGVGERNDVGGPSSGQAVSAPTSTPAGPPGLTARPGADTAPANGWYSQEIVGQLRWDLAGTLRLTPEQEQILRRPADPLDVEVNYDGSVYISWVHVWQVLLDAFGPGNVQLIRLGPPRLGEEAVITACALVVNGVPIGPVYGEGKKDPRNKKASAGNAIEASASDAITKASKQLGVFAELWDRRWVQEWKEKHAKGVWDANRREYITLHREQALLPHQGRQGEVDRDEYTPLEDYRDQETSHMAAIQEERPRRQTKAEAAKIMHEWLARGKREPGEEG